MTKVMFGRIHTQTNGFYLEQAQGIGGKLWKYQADISRAASRPVLVRKSPHPQSTALSAPGTPGLKTGHSWADPLLSRRPARPVIPRPAVQSRTRRSPVSFLEPTDAGSTSRGPRRWSFIPRAKRGFSGSVFLLRRRSDGTGSAARSVGGGSAGCSGPEVLLQLLVRETTELPT